ncbi:hypothetical protein AHAS_Ahas17G0187200 [Arachis hypogaea]
MLGRGFMCIWWLWLTTTRRSTTSIRLVCIRSWIVPIKNQKRLLPRRVSIRLRFLLALISNFLMQTSIVIFISYNIVRTKLIAKKG